jgi:hypothetical protein
MAHASRWLVSLIGSVFLITPAGAQDLKLRMQAIHLLEMANAVSLTGGLRDYKQVVSFTAYDQVTGEAKSGTFTRLSAGAEGHRDEITFGNYHSILVLSGDRISSTQNGNQPPEARELLRQIPIRLGRFDHEDVIQSIDDMSVLGRPAKCINFQTQFGDVVQNNQICVDADRQALLRWRVGDELVENTQFFQIANLWEPGHIQVFEKGALRLEIEQSMTPTKAPVDANAFVPPSGAWNKRFPCVDARRPVAVFTPMPPPGRAGTGIVDVVVFGWIWNDGTVRPVDIDSSPRPDLNAEALKLVSTWRFLPLLCNDRVAITPRKFVVHFQDR